MSVKESKMKTYFMISQHRKVDRVIYVRDLDPGDQMRGRPYMQSLTERFPESKATPVFGRRLSDVSRAQAEYNFEGAKLEVVSLNNG